MAHIVIVGGGHTHIEISRLTSQFVDAGHTFTLVSPDASHPYSGMGPGLLGGTYSLSDVLLPAARLVEQGGGTFVQGRVVSHDPDARVLLLSDGRQIGYDVLSLNMGSEPAYRPLSSHGRQVFMLKPIYELSRARAAIEERCARDGTCRIAIIGGGPGGVEVAANCALLTSRLHARATIDLYSASELIARLDRKESTWVERYLSRHGVTVHTGTRVSEDDIEADVVFVASGIKPPKALEQFGLPLAADGGVVIDRFLRSPGARPVFAVGDCASFAPRPLDRVGVFAVRMQSVLAANLAASAQAADKKSDGHETSLTPFTGTGTYLAGLNLGFSKGLLYRGTLRLRGKSAFRLKDAIDRRFVNRYRP